MLNPSISKKLATTRVPLPPTPPTAMGLVLLDVLAKILLDMVLL
jgi:hypothetical protein